MPMTAAASFQRFRSNLEITSLQQSTVAARQNNVRDAVARRMNVLSSFVTGSYKRHTMISPLKEADIDLFVILDPSYYSVEGYVSILDRVRSVLLETYSQSPRISRNGQAVSITFTDFVVDVVPAFHRTGGGYLIPSSTQQRWISTNPTTHESYVTQANQSHSGDLVPLVKMIKAWNRNINRAFRSFYLELLVVHSLNAMTISNDWSGCRHVFGSGAQLIRSRLADPAGLDALGVPGLAGVSNVTDGVSRFETAYNRCLKAEQLAKAGRTSDAITEWRKVFGDSFPAYG